MFGKNKLPVSVQIGIGVIIVVAVIWLVVTA